MSANVDAAREYNRRYWLNNRDTLNSAQREKYAENLEKSRERQRRYYAENIEKRRANARAKQARRYAQDPSGFKAAARVRHENVKRSVPCWFGELDCFVWQEAMSLSVARSLATGFAWQADHMIPVKAKEASGLHVWNNCQVIPRRMNRSKSNKMVITQPGEWIGAML